MLTLKLRRKPVGLRRNPVPFYRCNPRFSEALVICFGVKDPMVCPHAGFFHWTQKLFGECLEAF